MKRKSTPKKLVVVKQEYKNTDVEDDMNIDELLDQYEQENEMSHSDESDESDESEQSEEVSHPSSELNTTEKKKIKNDLHADILKRQELLSSIESVVKDFKAVMHGEGLRALQNSVAAAWGITKVKRCASSYNMFMAKNMADVIKSYPNSSRKERMEIIGKMWKNHKNGTTTPLKKIIKKK